MRYTLNGGSIRAASAGAAELGEADDTDNNSTSGAITGLSFSISP